MASNFDDILSQYEDITTTKSSESAPKFSMKNKGDKARIAFPLTKQNGAIVQKPVHFFQYSDNETKKWAKFFVPENKDSKAYELALRVCGEPITAYVTPVVVYATNDKGAIVASPVDYNIVAMILRGKRLERLKTICSEYNLRDYDLIATCDEPKFQDISFMTTSVCAFRVNEIKSKNRQGQEITLNIGIDTDNVIKESLEFFENIESAVASKWSDASIEKFCLEVLGEEATPKKSGGWDEDPDVTVVGHIPEAENFDEDEIQF